MKNVIIQESAYNGDVNVTKKNDRTVEFIACVQTADEPNRNGRIYPKRVLEKALDSPYIKERLATRTLYVECGHPMDTSVQRQMTIDLRNVAAIIEEFWWEGNNLKARITTADTAVGRDMMGLIEQGSKVAFSLRAQGSVHTNPTTGLVEVEDGLQICTYDWVCNPSHAKAFLEKICEETIRSMYGTDRKNLNSMVLTESANTFENGNIIDEDSTGVIMETIDYTKKYNTNFKYLSEMYIPSDNEKVISMDDRVTVVESGNFRKNIVTEDYLVKNIRKSIMKLTEEPSLEYSEELGNSATEEKKPVEARDDIDNKDVYPEDKHQQAEAGTDIEVK